MTMVMVVMLEQVVVVAGYVVVRAQRFGDCVRRLCVHRSEVVELLQKAASSKLPGQKRKGKERKGSTKKSYDKDEKGSRERKKNRRENEGFDEERQVICCTFGGQVIQYSSASARDLTSQSNHLVQKKCKGQMSLSEYQIVWRNEIELNKIKYFCNVLTHTERRQLNVYQ